MKMNQNLEEKITQALCDNSSQIYAPSSLKDKIDRQLDHGIMEETNHMKRWNWKKGILLIAGCCFLLSMGVFAAGQVTGYVTSLKPDKNYSAYSEVDQAAKDAGFDFKSVESFSNGYHFVRMSVSTTDKTDEDFNRVGSFQEWSAEYANDAGDSISLYAYQTQPETNKEGRIANATTEVNGIEVNYYIDHYKFVPADYELTEEDKANEAKENYYISYGTDEVEENDYVNVDWEENGISYYFQGMESPLTSDALFEMVKEVIEQ